MGPKDVIRNTLEMSDFIIKSYIKDLSDADLRLRPVEGMHPIALQLGHLIAAERLFMEWIKPGSAPREFRTTGQPQDVTLVPFYRLFDERYAVYWKVGRRA